MLTACRDSTVYGLENSRSIDLTEIHIEVFFFVALQHIAHFFTFAGTLFQTFFIQTNLLINKIKYYGTTTSHHTLVVNESGP